MTPIQRVVSDHLEKHVAERGIAGVAVVGDDHGDPYVAWIPSDRSEEPMFLAYSITKTFTAAILLLFQEEERLSLDAALSEWLPAIPYAERISLRQILNHTAGIPDYGGLTTYKEEVRSDPSHAWSFDRFVEETYAKGPLFEPGKGWEYSNLGYMFLKRIAESITGESFSRLIARSITEPLGLTRTFLPEEVADLISLAPALSQQLSSDGEIRDVREWYHPGWVSHSVVASTPSELVRFYDALSRERIISADSLREMTTFVPVPIHDNSSPWDHPSYGLGIMGDPRSKYGIVYGHSGGGPGYNTSLFHAPELGGSGVTVCVMAAIEEGFDAEEHVVGILDLVRDGA